MKDFHKFLHVLEEELSYQEALLELLSHERAAIVQLNNDEIENVRNMKEQLLDKARSAGDIRNAFVSSLTAQSTDQPKLSDVTAQCADRTLRERIDSIGNDLRATARRVQELSQHNAQLIKQTLGLIASTLTIFRGCPEADLPVYTRAGSLKREDSDPAFARQQKLFTRQA